MDLLTEARIPKVGVAGSSAGALAAATRAFGINMHYKVLSEWLKEPELKRLHKTRALYQLRSPTGPR